ncbi:MAG: NAD(P)/FAD-dependent oxidoreductase [Kineosporiaceae bacterium]|nr:NAD(P)/FAD-dependent oxidoreductase [Aeromicrobium sp.]
MAQDEVMSEKTCDVVVIGAGPGGEALAAKLSTEGLDVVCVEAELVGGECPYWGCIPSKMLIRAANLLAESRRVEGMAGSVSVRADFSLVAKRIREEATDNWDDTVAVKRLTDAGVTFVRGHGRLVGDRKVDVNGVVYVASKGVVLNTGTRSTVPPIDGLADTPYWTNREALKTETAPASMIVIGGGAIGLELAQAFSRFGTVITLIEAGPRILGPEEPEASAMLEGVLIAEGLDIHTGVTIDHVEHHDSRFALTCGDSIYEASQLLVAAGRESRLDDIGLDTVGLDPSARFLDVDDSMRVKDGLWAIGDIVGRGAFTHVSMYQSARAANAILGEELGDYDFGLPRVTFTDPEVGAVGMTEKQARDAGINVKIGHADIPESSRGWIHKAGNDGLIKLVIDADRDVLVGATSAGPMGGETLSALAVAVRAAVPLATLRNSLWAYPTFHRAIETAL